jgi:hypothetical protein
VGAVISGSGFTRKTLLSELSQDPPALIGNLLNEQVPERARTPPIQAIQTEMVKQL